MTVHVLPVPARLTIIERHDPELLDRVREARARQGRGEGVSSEPFDLTNVTNFRGRITSRWRRDDEKPLFQRMVEARDNG